MPPANNRRLKVVEMTQTNESQFVQIASSGALAHMAWFTAGFGCLVMLPLAISALAGGELGGLFFLVVPIGMIGLATWVSRSTPAVFATLYSDRLVQSARRGQGDVVRCADIESMRWPTQGGADVPIRLQVREPDTQTTRTVHIKPGDAAIGDRATLIGFLHLAAGHVTQANWPEYCVRCAVPLLDRPADDANRTSVLGRQFGEPSGPTAKLAAEAFVFLGKHPFFSGLFMPPMIFAVFVLLVSREAYWMTAAAIAVSAIVNIRLVWGQWVSPFTEICWGFAAGLFVLGCLSPPRSAKPQAEKSERVSHAEWWLLLLIVGGPLLANAAQAKFVPNWFAKYVLLISLYGIMLVPTWLAIRKRKRQLKRDAEPGSEPLARWEAYENDIEWPASPQ